MCNAFYSRLGLKTSQNPAEYISQAGTISAYLVASILAKQGAALPFGGYASDAVGFIYAMQRAPFHSGAVLRLI